MTASMACCAVILVLMGTGWLISVALKNVGIVDILWGLGFVLVAWTSLLVSAALTSRSLDIRQAWEATAQHPARLLLPWMTTLWGLRLSLYLAWRNHGRPEDKRYAAMRSHFGAGFWWQSLFLVFLLQGVVMWVVSLPLQFGIADSRPGWTILHALGTFTWGIGMVFETVGDWQLARFRADASRHGQVLDQGLWKYTRHPNYFGDCCVWWGIYLVAAAQGRHLWTVISPILMTFLLLRISGVTLLEAYLTREKPAYADYVRRTSPFFPWPPARGTK